MTFPTYVYEAEFDDQKRANALGQGAMTEPWPANNWSIGGINPNGPDAGFNRETVDGNGLNQAPSIDLAENSPGQRRGPRSYPKDSKRNPGADRYIEAYKRWETEHSLWKLKRLNPWGDPSPEPQKPRPEDYYR